MKGHAEIAGGGIGGLSLGMMLARSGWTPERSIVFAFWDAEEFGLIGSTEYAEAMQAELREKAIVYINTDLSMRGRFDGGGTGQWMEVRHGSRGLTAANGFWPTGAKAACSRVVGGTALGAYRR